MKLTYVLVLVGASASMPVSAQVMGGGAASYPQASTYSTNRSMDAPPAFVEVQPNPFQNPNADGHKTCLRRKRGGSVICRSRAEWEQIAARLAAKD